MKLRWPLVLPIGIAALGLAILLAGCGGGRSDEERIRESADEFVALLNTGDFAGAWELGSEACKERFTQDEFVELWESFRETLGGEFTMEIAEFTVASLEGERATVEAEVNVETPQGVVSADTEEEPFFDLFVKEDGRWLVGDHGCGVESAP
jgi:hypothetical protein